MSLTRFGKHKDAKAVSKRRRHIRIRKKISGTAATPRLVVTRSTRHVFVQIVDDVAGKTLASASTFEEAMRKEKGDKTAKARKGDCDAHAVSLVRGSASQLDRVGLRPTAR